MNKYKIYSLIIFFLIMQQICYGQNKTEYHPDMIALEKLLFKIKESHSSKSISFAEMDSLVSYFQTYEQLGYMNKKTKYNTGMSDSAYVWTYRVLDKIVKYSKEDTLFIHTLIRLDHTIRRAAELAESIPCYIQSAVETNVEGFLKMYQNMNIVERQKLIYSVLDWPCYEVNIIDVLKNASLKLKDKDLKVLAAQIANSLHVNN